MGRKTAAVALILLIVFFAGNVKGGQGAEYIRQDYGKLREHKKALLEKEDAYLPVKHHLSSAKKKTVIFGRASWYGPGFHGRVTANGEIFDENKMTAAHRELPFGTKVLVTNLNNGKSTVVTINDRGPYIKGRHIDLSKAAAAKVGMIEAGVVDVKMEILSYNR